MNITLIHESAFSIHSYDMFMNITWIITLIHESAVSMERVIKSSFELEGEIVSKKRQRFSKV